MSLNNPERSAPSTAPIFIGGTGRSGTTATSKLLSNHSSIERIRFELRIHVVHGGLLDLVAGKGSLADFVESMQGPWFYHEGPALPTGLHRIIEREALTELLDGFVERFATDKVAAGQWLLRSLLDPVAAGSGKVTWAEHSPENAIRATQLQELLPDLRFIHSVRDGRDVAASMMRPTRKGKKSSKPVPWGPQTFVDALAWWEQRLREAHAETSKLPEGRLFILRFEDLVVNDRDGTYHSLLEFLGLKDEPRLRKFFDRDISTDKANIGRWRDDVPASELPEFQSLHNKLVAGLRRDGLDVLVTS